MFAGIVKLYQKNPDYLHQLLLLQLIHTRSHLSFEVDGIDKNEIITLMDSHDLIHDTLTQFDQDYNDGRNSKYIGGFESLGELYLFFIREYKRTGVITLETTAYNTECEWIIFRIPRTMDQIKVSYQSNIPISKFIPIILGMVEIAAFREEDLLESTENYNNIEDVSLFFWGALASRSSPLVELKLEPSPIRGGPVLHLIDRSND